MEPRSGTLEKASVVEELRSRETILVARLADLRGYWLEVHCGGCGQRAYWPCPLMARQHGSALLVKDALPRLRCKFCKGRASRVFVTNFPARTAQYSDTWAVALLGATA